MADNVPTRAALFDMESYARAQRLDRALSVLYGAPVLVVKALEHGTPYEMWYGEFYGAEPFGVGAATKMRLRAAGMVWEFDIDSFRILPERGKVEIFQGAGDSREHYMIGDLRMTRYARLHQDDWNLAYELWPVGLQDDDERALSLRAGIIFTSRYREVYRGE